MLLSLTLLWITSMIGRIRALECRCFPGDSCWPSSDDWAGLNQTVHGRLIATIPLASVCHDPTYDAEACIALKQRWPYASVHIPSSSSFSSPWAQNQTCDPYTPQDKVCEIGNYPVYAVNASTTDHVAATLKFVRENNIRLIIKSTGHDLLGKSSGAGSLSLWMHSFQGLDFTQSYSGSNTYNDYQGPAVRIEPGVIGGDIQMAAQKEGLRVVGGTCGSVAIGGGYTTGGGHSLLSGKYGLSADNVLEWEMMTASGELITATPSQNEDLYWALSGGGAGVFGVIVGVTLKAFPDGIVSGAGISFNISASPSEDAFWLAVESFHNHLPEWQEQSTTATYSFRVGTFSIQPIVLPDQNEDALRALIGPFLSDLDELEIPYTSRVVAYPTYLDLHATYYGPLPEGQVLAAVVQVSRLLPRSLISSTDGKKSLISTLQKIYSLVGGSLAIVGNGIAVPKTSSAASSNSVNPAWRDSAIHQLIVWPWNWQASLTSNLEAQDTLLNVVLQLLKDLSPGSGTYLNEGNPEQADWKEAFYGENYDRLRSIKARWDSDDLFYAVTGVGSDDWGLDSVGRLCKV
ncbi:unnamed protein product [Clonostachys solani]|uniref:FAD-binding PCMH-type domain-containing protein n=1 Tax=Clonostachys solani TaxID=160281 RepID=A0A9N9ZLR4_9HYPO|nr:unnamed protein product [Clonostachys solani]